MLLLQSLEWGPADCIFANIGLQQKLNFGLNYNLGEQVGLNKYCSKVHASIGLRLHGVEIVPVIVVCIVLNFIALIC